VLDDHEYRVLVDDFPGIGRHVNPGQEMSPTKAGGVNQSIRGTRHDEKTVVDEDMCWCAHERLVETVSGIVVD
jgi:hypothetical protein